MMANVPIMRTPTYVPIKPFEVALKYICTTTTNTGMKVKAFLVNKFYPKGEKVSHRVFNKIKEENIIFSKRINPSWNYTVIPSKN